jgi:hypothetical protein
MFSFRQSSHISKPQGQFQQNGSSLLQAWHLKRLFGRGLADFMAPLSVLSMDLILTWPARQGNIFVDFFTKPSVLEG